MKNKRRTVYFLLIVITIPIGLATRKYGASLPGVISTYGGDVLYATCALFIARFLLIKTSLLKVSAVAYLYCICIETFQLYQAGWIEKVRHTFPFGLILGYGFLWSDWICYAVGVMIGFLIGFAVENYLHKRLYKSP